MYPDLGTVFYSSLLSKKEIILQEAKKIEYKYPEVKSWLSRDLAENVKDGLALYLLAYLLPTTVSRKKKSDGKVWKPSKIEVRDGFILQVSNYSNIDSVISTRCNKLKSYNCSLQPFIIFVGESICDVKASYVVIGNERYEVENIARAVDVCFKIIHSTNVSYQSESQDIWLVIQRGFYNLKTSFDFDCNKKKDYITQTVRNLLNIIKC